MLIFSLGERELRQAIAPELKMTGFSRRAAIQPTGRLIFDALARLHLVPATANAPPIVPAPAGVEAQILELLEVDPLTTR